MKRREAASLASDALKLRRWALRLFSLPVHARHGVTGGDDAWRIETAVQSDPLTTVPSVAPRAWELFLRAERCALPMRRRLSALGLHHQLAVDAARVIATLALEEMQRVISARAQLQRLSRWAISDGAAIVVLKGAVAAIADDDALDLSDIDLWIEPGTEAALLDCLSANGHVPKQNSSQHHHAGRLADQLVSVEVHHEIPHTNLDADWTCRTRPLCAALPGLKRLDATDNLWHVLIHSTIQHIERRGRIRDLLLLAHARSFCTELEWQAVRSRARAHEGADALVSMLDMSAAIGAARDNVDAFVFVAAGRYLDTASGPHRAATRFLHSNIATTAVLYGVRGCSHQLERVLRTRGATSPVPVLRWLQRRSPRIGGGLVLGLRIIRRVVALLFAMPRAYTARRLGRSTSAV